MIDKDLFICPKCGYKVSRDNHYLSILDGQNFVNIMMNNKEIINLCGNCNYFEYKN